MWDWNHHNNFTSSKVQCSLSWSLHQFDWAVESFNITKHVWVIPVNSGKHRRWRYNKVFLPILFWIEFPWRVIKDKSVMREKRKTQKHIWCIYLWLSCYNFHSFFFLVSYWIVSIQYSIQKYSSSNFAWIGLRPFLSLIGFHSNSLEDNFCIRVL